jgi:hypothetical protein
MEDSIRIIEAKIAEVNAKLAEAEKLTPIKKKTI